MSASVMFSICWTRTRVASPPSRGLLREPLEVFVPLRGVGEQIGGPLERDGAERAQAPPYSHAQAGRRRRDPHEQEEQGLLAHVSEMKQEFQDGVKRATLPGSAAP